MIRKIVVVLFLLSFKFGLAQEKILRYSWRLSAIGFDMVECRRDAERDSCLGLFNATMDSLIQEPGSYTHQFDSVYNVRILPSPDKDFRLITWGFRHPNDSFTFYGMIQYADEKREVVWLADSSAVLKNQNSTYYQQLGPEQWYGAIYYQIEKVKYKKETYYLLLGWNGKDFKTDQKILEVLSWNENEEPVFGLPLFDMDNGSAYQQRVIWEYKNGANMTLKITSKKIITFEHIEPADTRAHGIYTLYLPDGTYDFFKLKKGIWVKEVMLYDMYKNPGD